MNELGSMPPRKYGLAELLRENRATDLRIGLAIFSFFNAKTTKHNRTHSAYLPSSKRRTTNKIAGWRLPRSRALLNRLKGCTLASAGRLSKRLHPLPGRICLLIPTRLFLRRKLSHPKSSISDLSGGQRSFLEIDERNGEQNLSSGNRQILVTSRSSHKNFRCDSDKTFPDGSVSFFAWNDSTAVDSGDLCIGLTLFSPSETNYSKEHSGGAHSPFHKADISLQVPSDAVDTASEPTARLGSRIGRTARHASDVLKIAVKKHSTYHTLSRDGVENQKSTHECAASTKHQGRRQSSSPGWDECPGSRSREVMASGTNHRQTESTLVPVSIAINGVPASEIHFASSYYVPISPPHSPPATTISPGLLNLDWAPRPPLRERCILVSLRLTGRGFGTLKGRSLGCYVSMESTLASVKVAVEEQLNCDVELKGMVRRVSFLPTRMAYEGKRRSKKYGVDASGNEWAYGTLADEATFARWVEERVLADEECAALDVFKVLKA